MWNIDKAREVYNFSSWGGGYFDVSTSESAHGHLVVYPDRNSDHPGIDLYSLMQDIHKSGLALPVLVRFPDILHDRLDCLCQAFEKAIEAKHFTGRYTAVYPIKVNQQKSVVQQLIGHGGPRLGLEAGSKAELMAVLGLSDPNHSTIICNGYKDREYLRLAMIGQQMGHDITIVLEKPTEVRLVLAEAESMQIQPKLGLRMRLATVGHGNWQNTGGDKSKFGFSAAQALQVIEQLRQHDKLHCLQLLHCHMGSQLNNIRDIRQGLQEVARYYAEFHSSGIPIQQVDVGGGLGIDYDGTHSRNIYSVNYSLDEYAETVVSTLWTVCSDNNLPHPDIITESGRALTAHHAVLITNVVDVEQVAFSGSFSKPENAEPECLRQLWEILDRLNLASERNSKLQNAVESYHDAQHWQAVTQSMYLEGLLSMSQKAQAESMYAAICTQIVRQLDPGKRSHREIIDSLNEKLADKYFCNLSIFQSIPDVWAIQQIFPITPLNRLDEEPVRRGVIQDITCDSDGRIDNYVDSEGIESTLPLHEPVADTAYYVGMFLVGAYQEILGDMHNLFGDTHAVNVCLDAKGGYYLDQTYPGDNVDEVLRYVHLEPTELLEAYQKQLNESDLPEDTRNSYLNELDDGLYGYTYLEE